MQLDINQIRKEFEELTSKITTTSGFSNYSELKKLYSRSSYLQEIIELYDETEKLKKYIKEIEEIIDTSNDGDLVLLAKNELALKTEDLLRKEKRLKVMALPEDQNDNSNVILEIRAGTGGEEASLFARDLMRMYTRYANMQNWEVQITSMSFSSTGGIKEAVIRILGNYAYRKLKYESGVHRVQRIPETESSGRIHTSAASVVVMPEVDEVSVQINPNDIRIDTYRSSGHGGQSVNTTYSAVRVVHIPTGIIVTCQDTKNQHQNRESALSILRSRIYKLEQERKLKEINQMRKESIKTGDRSDKIKTYNFQQNRLTDHRIKKSWFGLQKILDGEIEDIIEETQLEISK